MSSFLLVLSTASSSKEASRIANILLDRRLAACVNIVPGVESHYWWKGKKEKGAEVLLLIKTQSSLYPKLEKALKSHHSYDVPEVIAIPFKKGSKAYLSWLKKSLYSL